ncbi:MAG: glycosyl hydrolase [Thalassobius sp.]|nr:glycosyl hydrolase [Thalassovita sp.]
MNLEDKIVPEKLLPAIERFWDLSGRKILSIEQEYDVSKGSPVFTVKGKYTTKGWTEWTQGFQYGSAALQFDITGDQQFLEIAKKNTVDKMASHVSHTGVHDHGFNNISTYGNLLRLMKEEKIPYNQWEKDFYELALKVSATVQAGRWTKIKGGGFIYSFNGPHSLFVDTIRSVRVLMLGYALGHQMMIENDRKISLLRRAINHAISTAQYSVFYGEDRDIYDLWGRTAHECIFNVNDGNYRCPNSQQGYTGFTTWTRGLSWAMLGFAEELEFLDTLSDDELRPFGGRRTIQDVFLKAARATCDFYMKHSMADGIPFWDTGAPNLYKLGNCYKEISNPYNNVEPVDSSAACIGAQALLRLGNYLKLKGNGIYEKYEEAGWQIVDTLLKSPYLSESEAHQGLILHSIYHHPNGWDYIPEGSKIPNGESSMWGDYHARELMLYAYRLLKGEPYYTFFNCL